MSEIYLITYYEYPLSISGRGVETTQGYTQSKYDADQYIESKNKTSYGEYRIKPVSIINNKL